MRYGLWSIAVCPSVFYAPRCALCALRALYALFFCSVYVRISRVLSLGDGFFGSLEFEKLYVEKISPNFKYLRIFFVSKISTSPGN